MTTQAERLKDLSEIGIVIDTWDDIFSDFDPSPLTERTLSVDFIEEVKKRYRERTTGNVYLTVYAPKELSSVTTEKIVLERIKSYFDFKVKDVTTDRKREIRRGVIFCLWGFCILVLFGAVENFRLFGPVLTDLFKWPIDVSGWFLMFEGFTFFAIPAKEFDKEFDLYSKLRDAEYRFSYVPTGVQHHKK